MMALPLPKILYDVQPGGRIVTAMGGINSLNNAMLNTKMQSLKNKYYPQDIQSQIGYRNALTQGQNINNQYLPRKLALANALAELHNQFYAPNMQSEIDNRNAMTQKSNTMTPLQAEQLRLQNEFYPEVTKAGIESQKAMAKYRNSGGFAMSAPQKELKGFENQLSLDHPEWTPEQLNDASNAYLSGNDTFSDGTPLPPLQGKADDYLKLIAKRTTTAPLITAGIKAKQAEAELSVLSKYADEGLEPYGTTYFDMSPQQIFDSFKGDKTSQIKLGRFIASQALQYEASQNRIRLANGQPGVTATEGLMKASGQLINAKFPRLSGVARQEATRFLDEALRKGLEARNSVDISIGGLRNKTKAKPTKSIEKNYNMADLDIPEGYVGLYKGNRQIFIPPDKVDEALAEGFTYE